VRLHVPEESRAGRSRLRRSLQPGNAHRIMTGETLPQGRKRWSGRAHDVGVNTVRVDKPVARHALRRAGEDTVAGACAAGGTPLPASEDRAGAAGARIGPGVRRR